MYKVYILKCSDGSFYTGITTDLQRRVSEHNSGKLGAKYTKNRRPVELVYSIEAKDRAKATSLELEIKSLSRKQKLHLIENAKKSRCAWVNLNNPSYILYHDLEWGVEVHSDKKLFEMLVLEAAQAGLSWETILRKRKAYKKNFDNYDLDKIINYDEKKIEKLMKNKNIIRNRLKITSVIKNAKAFRQIQKEFGSFDKYIWSFVGNKQIKNYIKNIDDLPSKTELSEKISKDLKKRGMSFVGSTIIYAYMQAIGMVDDHEERCFRCKKK